MIELLQDKIALLLQREESYLQQIELLHDQIALLHQREESHLLQIDSQSNQIQILVKEKEEHILFISSLNVDITQTKSSVEKLENKNRGLTKIISNKSEKQEAKQVEQPSETEAAKGQNPKDRGNNGAKRFKHLNLEIIDKHIYPNHEQFIKDLATYIGEDTVIRYIYQPPKVLKLIYHIHAYKLNGEIYSGKAPKGMLLNSNYDSSLVAAMLQFRYIYSMPVERIIKYFNEIGFALKKPTAHGLLKKIVKKLKRLEEVLKKTVLEADYLNMDESYYKILTPKQGTGSIKGYIWSALAPLVKLVHFFSNKGSRSKATLIEYLGKLFKGAIQTDGLANYKVLETDEYPNIIRLACFQHCKRKFLDLKTDVEAQKVVEIINKLYHHEHLINPEWSREEKQNYRNLHAPPILNELKQKLMQIKESADLLPKSTLAKATNYTLNEYDALCNIILQPEYALDNNAIERIFRYLGLSRRNSLFAGSHAGADNMALYYSLACSCGLNNINTFDYFCDIINRLDEITETADDSKYRELLPDKWVKRT